MIQNTKYEDLREQFQPIVYYAAAQDEGTAGYLPSCRATSVDLIVALRYE